MSAKKKPPVTIIGAGAVGSALALALWQRGFSVHAVASKHRESARRLGRKVHSFYGTLRTIPRFPVEGIVFVAVPDDEIAKVARLISRERGDISGSVIFHCSGALSSTVLSPLEKKGAVVGSFHPLQSFTRAGSQAHLLQNIWIGIEGSAKAIAVGRMLARDLGSRALILSPQQKVLYHVAAVFGSNYFVTLLSVVEELGERLGLSRRMVLSVFEPIILRSYYNVKGESAAAALTGPIVRGDVRTVRRHREALTAEGLKRTSRLYTALAQETRVLATKKKPHAR